MTLPLVSCLCVTRNRRIFLRQAVSYFLRQALYYRGDLELVILDGSPDPNPDFKGFDSVRYVHEPSPEKELGQRFNRGVGLCRGEIVVQWDDDDWQAQDRVARQLDYMQSVSADLVLNSRFYWYDLAKNQAARSPTWQVREPCGFGSSFAFRKRAWERVPYRMVASGADSHFWRDVVNAGGRVMNQLDSTLFVYVRHGTNVSVSKVDQWDAESTREAKLLMGQDVGFYDELSEMVRR